MMVSASLRQGAEPTHLKNDEEDCYNCGAEVGQGEGEPYTLEVPPTREEEQEGNHEDDLTQKAEQN